MTLPSYIANKPEPIKHAWQEIRHAITTTAGEAAGLLAANTWLQGQIRETALVARSEGSRVRLSFAIDQSKEFLKRTDAGEEYFTAVLTDALPDTNGKQIPESVLRRWAESINANPIIGDVDHEEYDRLIASGLSDEQVEQGLREKRGIAKAVNAFVEKGKLYARIFLDKRYSKLVKNLANGISIEAVLDRAPDGTVSEASKLLGFTFAVNAPVATRSAAFV